MRLEEGENTDFFGSKNKQYKTVDNSLVLLYTVYTEDSCIRKEVGN